MQNKILVIGIVILTFVLQSCNKADSSSIFDSKIAAQAPTPRNENISEKKIEFKGVSFTYNPQVFKEVKAEEIAEQPLELETDIPANVAPQHLLFTFKTPNNKQTTIAVYPIDDFRRVWIPVEKNNTLYFDENLKNVKKLISNKNFRSKGEIPQIPFSDGGKTFEAKVKSFSFQSGKGVFYLAQFVQERAIVNNGHLEYDFQGISSDGKYYVLAQSSVAVSFLPDDYYVGKFEDYTIPETANWSASEQKKYDEYIKKISKRLENLPAEQYQPNLNELEKIISTLKIEK